MRRLLRCPRTARAVVALALVATAPLRAQGITVRPLQNLSFGALLPAVVTRVEPVNTIRAGQIELLAARGTIFEVRFSLPAAMSGAGTTLPLAFLANSGAASAARTGADVVRFDPRGAARFQLATADRAFIYLGGEARPRAGQPVGSYTAAVVVTIANLSN